MPGFFEKKIMADIVSQLRGFWPEINVQIVPSDYSPDGLTVRVWANDIVFWDLTIYGRYWVVFIGEDPRLVTGDPLKRPVRKLPLSVGAPPKQAAKGYYDVIREDWADAQKAKILLLTMLEERRKATE